MTTSMAPRAWPGRPRLGEILISAGVLAEAQLQAALGEQRKWGDRLGRTLVHMGFISDEALGQALSRQLHLPTCRPDVAALPPGVTDHLGVLACERYGVMPLGVENGALKVATADPSNAPVLDELASVVGMRVDPVIATEAAIGRAIRKHYYGEPIGPAGGPPAPLSPMPVIDLSIAAELTPGAVPVELTPIDAEPVPGPAPQEPAHAGSRGAAGSLDFEVEISSDPDLAVGQLREAVDRLEDDLAREVRALRGLVETLIDRGVITRVEFLAHVRARRD